MATGAESATACPSSSSGQGDRMGRLLVLMARLVDDGRSDKRLGLGLDIIEWGL